MKEEQICRTSSSLIYLPGRDVHHRLTAVSLERVCLASVAAEVSVLNFTQCVLHAHKWSRLQSVFDLLPGQITVDSVNTPLNLNCTTVSWSCTVVSKLTICSVHTPTSLRMSKHVFSALRSCAHVSSSCSLIWISLCFLKGYISPDLYLVCTAQ